MQHWSQPMITVDDVSASSAFWCDVLGAESGHGGDEYEQIVADGEILLQLHHSGTEDHHGPLAEPGVRRGNGVLLWFEVADFDGAVERIRRSGATIVRGPEVNPNAQQSEIWFGDPDGYTGVVAGESWWRPRA
ncbi:VOC family protein [Propionibacteriaceae bacterium Y1700]|uniref:VOC family protein n=1 Tax=Microlunatus sp. Y1700 TaxID=3418487 RepID=UPI003DA70079